MYYYRKACASFTGMHYALFTVMHHASFMDVHYVHYCQLFCGLWILHKYLLCACIFYIHGLFAGGFCMCGLYICDKWTIHS